VRRALRPLVIALLLLLWEQPGQAQSTAELERAKASFRAGAAAYAAGEYPAAIQALAQAYQLTPLPAIAFSLAQAERRQYFVDRDPRHLERAIELFRRYAVQEPNGTRRADALDALAQLEPLAAGAGIQLGASQPAAGQLTQAPTRVMIISEAGQAQAALDGGEAAPVPLVREVQPGSHRVIVEAPGYFPGERTVTAVAGELVLSDVALRERPSTLRIATSVDAELYLDGTFVSRGGSDVVLEQPSGKHTLTVAESGRRTQSHTLLLRRGETEHIEVMLEPSRQRMVARGLFIAGAVATASGVVLGLLTMHEDNQAEQFLSQRLRGEATPEGLRQYGESRDKRDRYRTATGVSLALAGALFCSAVLTYALDQPNPSAIQRAWLPSREPSATESRTRLRVEPALSASSVSVQLTAQF